MYEDQMRQQNKKLQGLPRMDALAQGIVTNLKKLQDELHDFVSEPDLAQRLKLSEMKQEIAIMEQRIKAKDGYRYDRREGLIREIPEYLVMHVLTEDDVKDMIDSVITALEASQDSDILFLDLEGVDIGRNGTLDLMQMHVPASGTAYIIYIHQLLGKAFTTSGHHHAKTFKDLLESTTVRKGLLGRPL
jgi:hypothetical protein